MASRLIPPPPSPPAKDPTGAQPDFVTERWVDEATDQLHQVTSPAGVAFTRLFSRQ